MVRVVTTPWGVVLKDRSVRKVENYCSRVIVVDQGTKPSAESLHAIVIYMGRYMGKVVFNICSVHMKILPSYRCHLFFFRSKYHFFMFFKYVNPGEFHISCNQKGSSANNSQCQGSDLQLCNQLVCGTSVTVYIKTNKFSCICQAFLIQWT